MRPRMGAFLLAGGAAALALGLSTATSLAATAAPTWTVSPGGSFTGAQSGKVSITDTVTHKSVVCMKTTAAGSFKSGSGLSGTGIGSLTALSLTSCTDAKGLAFTATASALPWAINATKFVSSVATTYGTVTGAQIALAATGCSATIAGTTSATGGSVVVHIHNSPSKLKFESAGGTLHVYVTSGCTGVFKNGNAVTVNNAYVVSPAQTITESS
jgi:hypothetical protein